MAETGNIQDANPKKANFFNGWDLKTLVMIAGILISIGYNKATFDNMEEQVSDIKKTMTQVWIEITNLKLGIQKNVDKQEEIEKRVEKHDRKLYP